MLLNNKIALVTGASKGIGRAIVEAFCEHGATVYANGINEDSLSDLVDLMKQKYNAKVFPLYFDICNEEKSKSAILEILKEENRLDILVNNAGIMKDSLIGMITKQNMIDTFNVNVFAMMTLIQLVTKIMSRQKSGSIINLASIVGVHGNRGQLVYSASKGAVITLTKTAAKELAPKNIRVNALAPGMINTDMFNSIGPEHLKERIDSIGMGRIGEPKDVANACVFLASDLSEYITGQIIGVDGSAKI